MSVRVLKWVLRVLVFGALVLVAAVLWLTATASGTRWLYERASPWIPAALTIEGLDGSLLGGLEARSVRWDQPSFELDAGDVRLDVDLADALAFRVGTDSLRAGSLRLRIGAGRDDDGEPFAGFESPLPISVASAVIDNLELDLPGRDTRVQRLDFAARLTGSRLVVARLSMDSDWLDVHASGEVTLTPAVPVNAQADWSGVQIGDQAYGGHIAVMGNLAELRISHRLRSPLALASEGTLHLAAGGWTADFAHSWERIEWTLPDGTRFASTEGKLQTTGNVAEYRVTGSFAARYGDWPEAAVEVDGSGDLAGFAFDVLRVAAMPGRLDASGRLDWSDGFGWDGRFALAAVDPATLLPELTGTLDARGSSTGRFGGGSPLHATLALDELDGTLISLPVSASGRFAYDDTRLDVAAGRVALGRSRATVAGSAGGSGGELALDLTLDAPDIGELLEEAGGSVAARARLGGTLAAPTVAGSLTASALAWHDVVADSLRANVELRSGRTLELEAGGEGLGDATRRADSWAVSISGEPSAHRLRLNLRGPGGEALLALRGGYADGTWAGSIDSVALNSPAAGSWQAAGPAGLRASADGARLDLLCLARQDLAGRACAEFEYAPGQPFDFALSIAELPLAALPLTPPAGVGLGGNVFVEASGEIAGDAISGSASLEVRDASVSAEIEGEREVVRFTRFAGNAGIEANRLAASADVAFSGDAGMGHVELVMADVRSLDDPIDGRASVNVSDLSLAALLVPGIGDPTGTLAGEISVHGTARAPRVTGRIELREGRFRVPDAGTEIRDLNLALEQVTPGSLAITGTATSGAGDVRIEGRTVVEPGTGLETDITIRGTGFELLQLPDMHVLASPDATVHVDSDAIRVQGRLGIPSAAITVQTIPETARKPSPDAVVQGRDAATNGSVRHTSVDLDVTLGDDVRFAGFGLTTGLAGNLRIQAAPRAPVTGLGRISLVGGRYEAYGQDLEIESGELIFSGPIDNPLLDVRAVRRLTDVTAGIHLAGTPSQLSSEVFSDPALSDVEALSYLLTGHALATADMGEGDLMNKAAFALGMSQAGAITSQVRSSLGLETLTLEGGVDDSRIVAGKRIGGRLLVEYGYGLVDQLGTLILKYQVNERLVLESSTGSVSTLDVVYKVRRN